MARFVYVLAILMLAGVMVQSSPAPAPAPAPLPLDLPKVPDTPKLPTDGLNLPDASKGLPGLPGQFYKLAGVMEPSSPAPAAVPAPAPQPKVPDTPKLPTDGLNFPDASKGLPGFGQFYKLAGVMEPSSPAPAPAPAPQPPDLPKVQDTPKLPTDGLNPPDASKGLPGLPG